MPSAEWRAMRPADLPAVMTLAAAIHPSLPEDAAVFAERLRLAPEGCLILDADGHAVGYLVSHPWRADATPALNALLGALPARPDCWYLHDIALHEAARGSGAAAAAVARLADCARAAGLTMIALTAIAGTEPFWRRQGFVARSGDGGTGSYGAGALFMERMLAA